MSECRRYMDDYPGARAECARNIAAGKLCHDCPKQPDSKESLLSENTALRAERDALVRERDEARDELLLTTRLDAELAMQRRAERAEADLAAALRERDEAREWNRQMVAKAASGGALDGYRELGAKCAALEADLAAARAAIMAYAAEYGEPFGDDHPLRAIWLTLTVAIASLRKGSEG